MKIRWNITYIGMFGCMWLVREVCAAFYPGLPALDYPRLTFYAVMIGLSEVCFLLKQRNGR
ncbi:hypothetical protein BBL07_22315 [Agrobacterium vitis]|nr:hypothetical protein BBL07_22315 [Agrobacterium vitis]